MPALSGSAVPGSAKPRSAVPGSAMPGSAMPGSAMTGSAFPCSAMPGFAMPGSAMTDSAVPGSALLCSVVPGSPVTGSAVTGSARWLHTEPNRLTEPCRQTVTPHRLWIYRSNKDDGWRPMLGCYSDCVTHKTQTGSEVTKKGGGIHSVDPNPITRKQCK